MEEGRWVKGKKDNGEKEKRKKGKRKVRLWGKGKKNYGEKVGRKKEKRDMSHSLTAVGGYVGLIQGFLKISRNFII